MTGKDHLVRVIELCGECENLIGSLAENTGKEQLLKTIADQKAVVQGMMDRVFFKTPKGANSASIVLEACETLRASAETLGKGGENASKNRTDAEESLREFSERVEGMVQAAQGKTLAFT